MSDLGQVPLQVGISETEPRRTYANLLWLMKVARLLLLMPF
jgi:hypothetical protein